METIIYGGTFDPPTRAHQVIIQHCTIMSPDKDVWVMPSGERRDKPQMQNNDIRLSMVKLMCQPLIQTGLPVSVSDFEQRLPQPNHTYETWQQLKATFPERNFWFVFGIDSYENMKSWEGGAELQRNMGILLVPRAGYIMPRETPRLRHLDPPEILEMALSSSMVREELAHGRPVVDMVTPEIAHFIDANRLYA